mgnify:CR=1 FL=1
MELQTAVQGGTGQSTFIDDLVKKLTLGTTSVELDRIYQLPPEAGGFKAVKSKRSNNGVPSPLLVLVNGNYTPDWYQRNGFERRREGTYLIKVVAQGDPYDGGNYRAIAW